jgi:hypothetical protein
MQSLPSRRRFLRVLVAMPAVATGVSVAAAARRGVKALRPGARDASGSVCAACGAPDHTMLDPACPSSPRVV